MSAGRQGVIHPQSFSGIPPAPMPQQEARCGDRSASLVHWVRCTDAAGGRSRMLVFGRLADDFPLPGAVAQCWHLCRVIASSRGPTHSSVQSGGGRAMAPADVSLVVSGLAEVWQIPEKEVENRLKFYLEVVGAFAATAGARDLAHGTW